jgi:ATP-dependent RNA helicase RhlE
MLQLSSSPINQPHHPPPLRPGRVLNSRTGIPLPFGSLKLDPSLIKAIKELGYTRPTPVQAEAIPPALAGQDVLACAMTGSGKTAAFLLPVINALISRPRKTTRALVLTPTRELAVQILEDLNDLAVHTPITGAAIIGGVSMGPQEHAFRSGADVLIATPGRLLDHARSPYAKLAGLEYLVIDEADRMLDMGFLPDIRRILRHLPPRRQTLFFSATMPAPILALTQELLRSPATIQLERKPAPAVGITHAVYPVPQHLKSALLLALLGRGDIDDALVFTRTKHRANRLAAYLVRTACRRSGFTEIDRRGNGQPLWPGSRAANIAYWSRPISRRAASTSKRWDTW